jgi:TolB-like protein
MKRAIVTCIVLSAVLLLSASLAVALDKDITMAVFDFKANGVSESLARSVTELFLVNLVESEKIRIVERTDIEKILEEHELMLSGLTEESDAIEAGKLLSANKVLLGSVNKFGERLLLTARVVDTEQGYTEHAQKAQLDSEEDLINEINRISKRIVTRVVGEPVEDGRNREEERLVPLENISSLPEAIMAIVTDALSRINREMEWDEDEDGDEEEILFERSRSREPSDTMETPIERHLYFLDAAYAGFDFTYYFSPLYFSSYELSIEPAFLLGGYGSVVFRGGFKVGGGAYAMVPFTYSGSNQLLFGFGGPLFGWEFGSDKFQVSIDVMIGAGRYSIVENYYNELMNEWYFAAFPKLRVSFELIDWVHLNIEGGYLYTNSKQYNVNSFVVGIGFQAGWWRENR